MPGRTWGGAGQNFLPRLFPRRRCCRSVRPRTGRLLGIKVAPRGVWGTGHHQRTFCPKQQPQNGPIWGFQLSRHSRKPILGRKSTLWVRLCPWSACGCASVRSELGDWALTTDSAHSAPSNSRKMAQFESSNQAATAENQFWGENLLCGFGYICPWSACGCASVRSELGILGTHNGQRTFCPK